MSREKFATRNWHNFNLIKNFLNLIIGVLPSQENQKKYTVLSDIKFSTITTFCKTSFEYVSDLFTQVINDPRRYFHYLLFNVATNLFRNILQSNIAGIIIGGLLQGYDDCEAQKKYNQHHPVAGIFVGALNGLLSCTLMSFGISLPILLGMSLISMRAMCTIESTIYEVLFDEEKCHKPVVAREGQATTLKALPLHRQQRSSCCHNR